MSNRLNRVIYENNTKNRSILGKESIHSSKGIIAANDREKEEGS
jgi:hypothetical protein